MSSTPQWYMAVGGQQVGPVSEEDILNNIKNGSVDAQTLVFVAGMDTWTPLKAVPKFAPHLGPIAPPPMPASARRSDIIDYRIEGEDMQFVEVELDPGEACVAEAGAMMYMTAGIQMDTIFGDGSAQQKSGIMGALLGAGKRVLTGESLFMTVFSAHGGGKERVAFAAPYPGRILAMDLPGLGGELVCQKDSFLCAAKGVAISIAFQKKIGVGLFGGEGFIMQRLTGDGLCFVNAGGMLTEKQLAPGETLRVDTGCLVALQPTVSYDVQFVGGIKTAFFGGEGLFFATLAGPGRVWLQSLPLSRMADRIYKAAPQTGGSRKGEGSILDVVGGIGNIIDGD
jgi:uncharacterized protein (TIGR00266 family)